MFQSDYFEEKGEFPCAACGSTRYVQDQSGNWHCENGHFSHVLREEEDEELEPGEVSRMTRTQMRKTMRLDRSRIGSSRGGDRDDGQKRNRYGLTRREVAAAEAEEKRRFVRHGEVVRFALLEGAMQLLLHQIVALRGNSWLWRQGHFATDAALEAAKNAFEGCARHMFAAYVNRFRLKYHHTDRNGSETGETGETGKTVHPGSHAEGGSNDALPPSLDNSDDILTTRSLDTADVETILTEELLDTETEAGWQLRRRAIYNSRNVRRDAVASYRARDFPQCHRKPFGDPFSVSNVVLITYVALLQAGLPVLMSDIAMLLLTGELPFWRADLLLSPDLSSTRLNHIQLRHFVVKYVMDAAQLRDNVALFLSMMSVECRVPDRPVAHHRLVARLLAELGLPACFYAPVMRRLETAAGAYSGRFHVVRRVLFVAPCGMAMAAILFFLRLLYGLNGDCVVGDVCDACGELSGVGLPTEQQLVAFWRARLEAWRDVNSPVALHEPVTDESQFDELVRLANRMLSIASDETLQHAQSLGLSAGSAGSVPHGTTNHFVFSGMNAPPWIAAQPPANFRLPRVNYARYRKYAADADSDVLPAAYRLALQLGERLTGMSGHQLHVLIVWLFEEQNAETRAVALKQPVFVHY